MTETTSPTHHGPKQHRPPVDPTSGAMAIGVPIQDTEAMIVGDDFQPFPSARSARCGCVDRRSWPATGTSLSRPPKALVDGWMRSGDVGFMDQAGWFYLVDRKKDMIVASGFKVWPREVEDVLIVHPAVREAAVVGRTGPLSRRDGEGFRFHFSPGVEASAEDIIGFCRERLAAYKVPRRIEVMEELPKTLTGKIQRVELRGK